MKKQREIPKNKLKKGSLESLFPKGDKRRGEVILIQAEAFFEGYDLALDKVLELINKSIEISEVKKTESAKRLLKYIKELKKIIENEM